MYGCTSLNLHSVDIHTYLHTTFTSFHGYEVALYLLNISHSLTGGGLRFNVNRARSPRLHRRCKTDPALQIPYRSSFFLILIRFPLPVRLTHRTQWLLYELVVSITTITPTHPSRAQWCVLLFHLNIDIYSVLNQLTIIIRSGTYSTGHYCLSRQ